MADPDRYLRQFFDHAPVKYTRPSPSAVIHLDNPLANLLTINRMRLAVPAKTSYSLLESPMPEPDEVVNHRTPFLDLDSLYGRGPLSQDSFLYDPDGLHFRLGGAATGTGQAFDVSLDFSGRPLLADKRNNENTIIRQIHAIFLTLHNFPVGPPNEDSSLSAFLCAFLLVAGGPRSPEVLGRLFTMNIRVLPDSAPQRAYPV